MARFWITSLRASRREKRCRSIKYASTKVADRLTPMMQCTSTFPAMGERECKMRKYKGHSELLSLIPFITFALQGFMYEVSCKSEVEAEVKVVRIICRDAEVNTGVPIKTLITDAALLGVCGIKDMSDAEFI